MQASAPVDIMIARQNTVRMPRNVLLRDRQQRRRREQPGRSPTIMETRLVPHHARPTLLQSALLERSGEPMPAKPPRPFVVKAPEPPSRSKPQFAVVSRNRPDATAAREGCPARNAPGSTGQRTGGLRTLAQA